MGEAEDRFANRPGTGDLEIFTGSSRGANTTDSEFNANLRKGDGLIIGSFGSIETVASLEVTITGAAGQSPFGEFGTSTAIEKLFRFGARL